jgi:curved DNA-binding protein
MAVADQDYYEALGVPRDAGEDEIRRAYRRLARQYHPDVNHEPGAEDRFKEISAAYEVLRDPEKRERYNRLGANWRAGPEASEGGFGDPFRSGSGGFSSFGGRDGFDDVRVDFEGGDFDDLFESFFSRRGGTRRSGFQGFSSRGGDSEAELELTLEEAARGGRRRLTLGDGRTLEVEIPAGVRDGQRIRLAGEGEPGVGGGPSGDLFLRVRLRPHPRFRVEGRNLVVEVPVTPWEAALGAEIPVPTLDGNARVKMPAGSSSGRRLRLRGEGLPDPGGGQPGNLYAIVSIRVPPRLSRRERELFEELASVSKFNPREAR